MKVSNRIRMLVIVLAFSTLLGATTLAGAENDAVISGTVYSDAGPALAGATVAVSLRDQRGLYRPVATYVSDAQGRWQHLGKHGQYRFHVTADRHEYATRYLTTDKGGTYALDVTLKANAVFGSISGAVVNGAGRTPIAGANVWLYKQNPDGTWPATTPYKGVPSYEVTTALDGTYSSGPLPGGNYRVRFFSVHTGSQYWQYVLTPDAATTVSITMDGQSHTGIEGWFNRP